MSHAVVLTDEEFQKLSGVAEARGQTPDDLVRELVAEVTRDPRTTPRYYETDDWLRHLGVTEEVIEGTKAQANQDPATLTR